ncbi:MAG: hypothetical protein LBT20_05600 [Clostridiales bacterium]|nr:hypothetical protein [Clostridiales bacterium]
MYNDLDGSLTELKKSVDTLRDKAEYASPSKQNEVYRIDLEIEKTIDSLKHSNGIGYKTDLITPEILKRISLMFDERNEETARYRR